VRFKNDIVICIEGIGDIEMRACVEESGFYDKAVYVSQLMKNLLPKGKLTSKGVIVVY
jgi:hypothetical protein